jgi:ABC-type uncharacterized transport system involved in gliding motility auxiliary subunit
VAPNNSFVLKIGKTMLNKISIASGWLGIVLMVTGLISFNVRPDWTMLAMAIELVSLLLLVFFFTIHFETVKSFSYRRSTKFGLNSLLMVIIFLSILGITNFISSHHSLRLDLSEMESFTLASQTVKVLTELNQKIKITVFTQSQTSSEARIKDFMDSYAYYTKNISYVLIDPDKKPAIAKNYGITQYDTLIFESGNQETQIKNITEQDLTNAIIRVTRDVKRTVLFLKEHGEHQLDDTGKGGYSHVKESLQKQGYEVDDLSLLQKGAIPKETSVLVIAGPQKPYLEEEKRAITTYLENGGKLLTLLDPQTQTNLEDILSDWGIQLGEGVIIDTLSRLFGGDFTIPIVNSYPSHEITEGFNLATFFPVAQMLIFEPVHAGLDFKPIAQTTPNSWLKININNQDLSFNPDEDIQGPLTIAGIVSLKSDKILEAEGDKDYPDVTVDESTIVVFGDSDFASNSTFYFSGNGDLFMNTINYLAKEKHLISITPKEHHFAPLLLSKIQGQVLMYISIIVMPSVVFIAGFSIWRRRRSL